MSDQTTVMFADLMGSTGVFETIGSARASRVVTGLTQWIGDLVVAHHGRVVKTLGDGVLAVFPHAPDAISSVVDIQRSHQKRIASSSAGTRMPIRIGVARGDVEFVDGDCYGDAVNVASRLSDLSGPHQIWANNLSLEKSVEADGVRFRPLGPITIRGRVEPCQVFQVEWHVDVTSDFLTMQATLAPADEQLERDLLGGEIELHWLDQRKRFRSHQLPIHIGRVSQAEFVVNDPRVSRTHARIDWRNGSILLVDVSTYGSWVRFSGGGADLLLRREECVLHGKGEIALGASFSDLSVPTVMFSVS
ncbi:MAG: adenylate/guanylate cyclase domain-containing protein [Rhodoferax sp.]|jgi:adenylate cyclase|nr:adenylate/guanylate cyclase domain-containing protein [Rhodoferax sp.]